MNCPVCKRKLGTAPGIGLVCCRKGCPVGDDYKLWTSAMIKAWRKDMRDLKLFKRRLVESANKKIADARKAMLKDNVPEYLKQKR
jgi:hypothetical protein